jgi:hypothetical protein
MDAQVSEDILIDVQIGDAVITSRFQNDAPYRGAAMERLEELKAEAIGAARTISEYLNAQFDYSVQSCTKRVKALRRAG